jgi:hypothetical protein
MAYPICLTEMAAKMHDNSHAGYKHLQRFSNRWDPRKAQWRLFQKPAAFVISA